MSAVTDRPRRTRLWAPAAAVAVTVLAALARLAVTPTFYAVDDTQAGTIGQWHALGEALLSGVWPMLDPHAWTGGNYLAEGQWGLFSPLIWLIAMAATAVDDVLLWATVVKIALLAVLALGVHLLARSFGAAPWWAAAAGVLAPLGGFTVYMDAASWTGGLMASALFPWAWWGLRVLVEEHRSPLWFLVASALLVTTGYVFGVLMLVIVLVESLVRALVRRDRRAILATLAASVFAGLLTVTVYLPGILTAPVTVREGFEIYNALFLNADLGDLAAASTATTTASIGSWYGAATQAPLVYVAWVLPALAFFLPVPRAVLRRVLPVLVVAALTLLIVTGPSHVGPLRWPVRFMPYLVIAVVVLLAVCATAAYPRVVTRARLWGSLGVLVGASWFAMVLVPTELLRIGVAAVVQVAGIVALFVVARRRAAVPDATRRNTAAGVTAGVAVVLAGLQLAVFPVSPLPQLGVVRSADAMGQVLAGAPGDGIVVGDAYLDWDDPASFSERLVANQWYFAGTDVSSVYTVLPHAAYVTDLCADLRGSTCPDALETLWSTDERTGAEVAELLGVNTVVVALASFPDGIGEVPEGWSLERSGSFADVYVRDAPVPVAGGVAWTGEGTSDETVAASDTRLELRVDAIGADAAVVLSRLDWPGYRVDGAPEAEATRGYLLTLDLSDAQPGDVVVVEFRPPGWALELAALVLALGLGAAWPIVAAVRRRRAARG